MEGRKEVTQAQSSEIKASVKEIKEVKRKHLSSFWDQLSHKNFLASFKLDEYLPHLEKMGNSPTIIDVGCGNGRITNFLFEYYNKKQDSKHEGPSYKNIIGCDFSEKMIEEAKKRHPHLANQFHLMRKIYNADGSMEKPRIPALDAEADIVVLFSVLTCNPRIKHAQELMQEVRRVLKPGGLLILNDFFMSTHPERLEQYQEIRDSIPDAPEGVFVNTKGGGLVRHFKTEEMAKLLKDFSCLWFCNEGIATISGEKDNPFQIVASYQPPTNELDEGREFVFPEPTSSLSLSRKLS